jgi:DNA-binding MarR family transcriptional regulator
MSQPVDVDEVASALYASVSLLVRRLRQLPAPGEELSPPERSALSRLDRGGPATAAELARADQITAQAMGNTLSSLERRGLVGRDRDPHDGRRIIMSVTELGTRTVRDKRHARAQQLAKVLAERFSDAELRTLRASAELVERLGEHL